jgi:hypothetical protein
MAENPARTKTEPLSERARRATALEAAKQREAQLYGHVVDNLGEFPELDSLYRGISKGEAQKQLLAQREEALGLVESDRAELVTAIADYAEARWRLRQVLQRLALLALALGVLGGGIVFVAYEIYGYDFFGRGGVALLSALALAVGVSSRGDGPRLIDEVEARRNTRRDVVAAENLLENAIREIALPSQLRQAGTATHGSRPLPEDPEVEDGPAEAAFTAASRLQPVDPTNLVELHQSPQQLATAGRRRLKSLVDALGSASLGIAGPRGVGKTSLLEWFFDHQLNNLGHLSVRIPAPVRYEPRDFVLSAFAQTCEAVGGREAPVYAARARLLSSVSATVLGAFFLLAGGVIYTTNASVEGSTRHLVGAGLMALGGILLLLRFSPDARRSVSPQYLSNTLIRDSENPDEIAPQLFSEISFQLTYTTGYSGKLVTGPSEVAAETTLSLAARQESFPDVVTRFRAFLEAVAKQRGKVYIGIDELDKMQVQDAVRFLDDIKGLFGVPNCFFLLCISEDALGQFERRGLPMRDAFDSAFDEVVRLEPLDAGESIALLRKRTGIDVALAVVCHILAGGLPRDVIRYARRLAILSQDPMTAEEAVSRLVHQDLQERARGLRTNGEAEIEDSGFRILVSGAEPLTADELAKMSSSLPPSLDSLSALALLANTVIELLASDPATLVQQADALAKVRASVAESPAVARSLCAEVRAASGLPPAGVA